MIHLLSALSSDPDPKYLTSGTQQRLVPAPGAYIAYQAHTAFSKYLAESGQTSVISGRAEAINTLIIKHFHPPLSMDKDSPFHIYHFNIVEKMPKTVSDNHPAFLR